MELNDRIGAIEARCRRLGRTLAATCRDAGVPFPTIWRWKTGQPAKTSTIRCHLSRLEGCLDGREEALRKALEKPAA